MKILLLEDVKKLGKKHDLVEVKDGFAINFLFPKKLAVAATKKAMEIRDREKKLAAEEHAVQIAKFTNAKKLLETEPLNFELTANKGKVFNSITSKQIAEEVKEKYNLDIDKHKISHHNLNSLGNHFVKVHLFDDIEANISVVIKEKHD